MTAYTDTIETDQPRVPWWIVLLGGIATLILGLLLLTDPGMTVLVLIEFLGAYWLFSGIIAIVQIFLDSRNWGWKLALGIIGILAGLTILKHPVTSAFVIPTLVVIFVAIEGVIFGVVSLVHAFQEKSWGMGILGAISVIFGILIFFSPQLVALGLPFVVGIVAIVGGVAMIIESFRVRGAARAPAAAPVPSRPMSSEQIPVTGPDDDEPGPKQEE